MSFKSLPLKEFVGIIIILALALSLYSHTVRFGFVWDDEKLIEKNPYIKNPIFIPRYFITDIFLLSFEPHQSLYYRPLLLFSFQFDYSIWGLNAAGFHLMNILLFLMFSALVYAFIKNVSNSKKIAFFTAVLFIIHPINVQTVSWISGRNEVLLTIFLLASFILFKKSLATPQPFKRIAFYLFSVLMFAFGLLSKEAAASLPLILIFYDYCFICNYKFSKLLKNLRDYIPYMLILLIYLYVRQAIFEDMAGVRIRPFKVMPPVTLLILNLKSIPFYIKSILLPFPIEFQAFKMPTLDTMDLQAIISTLIISIFIFYLFKYKPPLREEVFFLGWFIIFSVPILFIGVLMGTRFLVLPIVGLFGFSSLFLARWIRRKRPIKIKFIFYALLLAVIFSYGFSSYKTSFHWKDNQSILKLMLKRYPNDSDVHYNIGWLCAELGDLEKAIKEYKIALALKNDHTRARFNLAHAYYNLGRMDDAISELKMTLSQDNSMPYVHQALAVIYSNKGLYEEAVGEVKAELSLNANRLKMLEFLADLYEKAGEEDKARKINKLLLKNYY